MKLKEMYDKLHGDYDDACKRLINEGMIKRFLVKFPEDPSMQNLLNAVETGDIETSFRSAHTLKSVAGVLSFSALYIASWNLTEQLRPRKEQADRDLLELVKIEYAKTMDALTEYMNDPE